MSSSTSTSPDFLADSIRLFEYYKGLADRAVAQVDDAQLHWQPDANSNSIAVMMQHIAGNMRSRWTDFLNTDGEKEWRKRDMEFQEQNYNREALQGIWEMAWEVLFDELGALKPEDVGRTVHIRKEPHSVMAAMLRQLGHYSYHVGQIVQLARILAGDEWTSLSIPKGDSDKFNSEMDKKAAGN